MEVKWYCEAKERKVTSQQSSHGSGALVYFPLNASISLSRVHVFTLFSPSLVLPLTATAVLAGLVSSWEDSSESILDEGEEADNQLQQTHQSSPQGASHTTSWGQGDATLGGRRREALLPAGTGKGIVPRRMQSQIAEAVEIALSYLLMHCIISISR